MIRVVFFFFCFHVQATVFPSEEDLFYFNKDEVRNPYNFMIPAPFKEEVVSKAFDLLEQKRSEVVKYTKALKTFYNLNTDQIALILNERRLLLGGSDLNEIHTKELNHLYKNAEEKEIVNFIINNKLSSKQILIFIFPFLRDESLKGSQIVQVLKSVDFDVNTLLKAEDIVSLFLDSSLGMIEDIAPSPDLVFKKSQSSLMPDEREAIEALKQIRSLLFNESLSFKELEKNTIQPFQKIDNYYNPEMVITSIAHIALAHKEEELMKFLYKNKKFDSNLSNHIGQTPLHSLFMSSKKSSRKDWERLLDIVFENPKVDWNAKDAHGLSPLAVAISKAWVEALPVLFELKGIDLSIKDNYNRSLVIIASQSLPKKNKKKIIEALIQKGGDKLVMPSHFNDYIDENLNPITIHQLHPLRDVIFHTFSILRESEKYKSNQAIASLTEYDYKLRQSLKARNSLNESVGRSKSSYYQQPVVQAIRKDDRDFFEKFYWKSSDIKKFVEHIFIFPVKDFSQSPDSLEKIDYVPSYHLLLLAIKENSPKVVQFFLESVKNPYIFQPNKNENSFYMDILSESLIQSFRLSFENLSSKKEFEREQKKNLKIIETVMSNEKIDLEFKNFMDLTAMEIAFLTGQMEKVKALENKNLSLPEGDLWDTGVSYLDIVERQGFKKIADYMRAKQNIKDSSCYSRFIN